MFIAMKEADAGGPPHINSVEALMAELHADA